MIVRIILLITLLITVLPADSQEIFIPAIKSKPGFISGENLTYQIRYGFLVGGTTTISLIDDTYNHKEVFHATAIAQTTGMAEAIYGIKDIYESWFDKKTNLSYKQIRNIKEGSYTNYNEVTYNRKNNTVDSKLTGIHHVPAKILDLATSLYYLRRMDFSKAIENDMVLINIYFSDEVFPFYLRYKGKETIRTKFGKISCIKISPLVEVGRMFKTPDDVNIWLTDDDQCLPVSIELDIRIVGKIHLKLIKAENVTSPLIQQE